jgi:hypothetical protein
VATQQRSGSGPVAAASAPEELPIEEEGKGAASSVAAGGGSAGAGGAAGGVGTRELLRHNPRLRGLLLMDAAVYVGCVGAPIPPRTRRMRAHEGAVLTGITLLPSCS